MWLGIDTFSGGIIAGVLHTLLGPDHLSTIMTLSACQGADAFWFGVQWAGGHLTGMAVVGSTFALLNMGTAGIAFEEYEHFADYVIGAVMILFGAYFLLNADRYFDKEWSPKHASCSCHQNQMLENDVLGDSESSPLTASETASNQEKDRPVSTFAKVIRRPGPREIGSVLIGFLQGVACPAGLVGLSFLKTLRHEPLQMMIFLVVFFATTTLAMGSLAFTYGVVTRKYIPSKTLARGIYYTSCSLSMVLGCVWIMLNATGNLELLLAHLGHDHNHEHGHHEHHAHEHASMAVLLAETFK